MSKMIQRFWQDERGLELPEYAVMTALIIAAVILAIGVLSVAISDRFNSISSTISGIDTAP